MEKKESGLFLTPNSEKANSEKAVAKKKWNHKAIITAVVLIVLAILVIRPALLGYNVYQDAQASNLTVQDYAQSMEELSRDLEITKVNLSSYSTFTGALLAQMDEKYNELTDCKVQLEQTQSAVKDAQKQVIDKETEIVNIKSEDQAAVNQQITEKTQALEQEKAACESSLAGKETEVGNIQAKYNLLVKNAAKSICCKSKVDNPQINFYDVVDDKITCLEQGTNQLSC